MLCLSCLFGQLLLELLLTLFDLGLRQPVIETRDRRDGAHDALLVVPFDPPPHPIVHTVRSERTVPVSRVIKYR